MTTPLSAQQLAEIRTEVTRLRAESEHRLGELLFWEFEYRAAMDNYRGEEQHAKSLRAELEEARALEQRLAALFASGQKWKGSRLVSEHIWTCHEIRAALGWPEPTAKDAAPVCHCGHPEAQHQDATGLGGAQCRTCPGDDERSWRHPYEATPCCSCHAEPVHQAGCDAAAGEGQ